MNDIGNNSHGNKNELNFVENFKLGLSGLNPNLKEFVKYICDNEGITYKNINKIEAQYESKSKLKQDCYITINNHKLNISLKMGSGNSVHQERCEDFINYIKKEFHASKDICDLWRFFLWADGTLDGTGSKEKDCSGNIKSRFNANFFKNKYPKKRKKLQQFLIENERRLVEYFLFIGRHNSHVDYIYHGTPLHGSWISKKKILDFQINNSNSKNESSSCLSVGKMSIQSWNVSMKGTSEKKRGQIQVKYGRMRNDFEMLMRNEKKNIGAFQGDAQEFNLSKLMNKNKKHKFWSIILPDNKNINEYYIIKVTNKSFSKLSNKKVFPKSDAYIVKAKITNDILLQKEFILTENDLKNINYEIVPNSGISIKLKDSTNYTIQKFTKNSFIKAFSNKTKEINELFFSLLLYSNEKEIYKNKNIANDLRINYDIFIEKSKQNMCWENTVDKKFFDKIRYNAQIKLINIIKNDKFLKNAIFSGKGWFEDPYYATFLFIHGELTKNIPSEFYITTGSGRSKGKYTIEIKPR